MNSSYAITFITLRSCNSHAAHSKAINVNLEGLLSQNLKVSFLGTIDRRLPYTKLTGVEYLVISNERKKYIQIFFILMHLLKQNRDHLFYTRDYLFFACLKLLGRKVLFEHHDEPRSWYQKILLSLFKESKCHVFISNGLKTYLSTHYKIGGVVLPTPVKDEVFTYRKEFTDEKLRFVHTGQLNLSRGFEIVVWILKNFKEATIVQIGGDHDLIRNLSNQYLSFHERNRLFLKNHMKEKKLEKEIFKENIQLYIISPNTSTVNYCSPTKLVEYMCRPLPIFGFVAGAVLELADKDMGVFFTDFSELGTIQALEKFRTEFGELRHTSIRASEMNRVRFSASNRTANILEYYEVIYR